MVSARSFRIGASVYQGRCKVDCETSTLAPMPEPTPVQRMLGRSAALLFLISLLTGIYAGLAMTGKIPVDGHAALASHLNALMGTFLLLGFGWTLPMLRYGEVGQKRLALVFIGTSFANWIVTAVKAALKVAGLAMMGKPANDAIFVALQITVVLPTIIAAIAWVVGFKKPSR